MEWNSTWYLISVGFAIGGVLLGYAAGLYVADTAYQRGYIRGQIEELERDLAAQCGGKQKS